MTGFCISAPASELLLTWDQVHDADGYIFYYGTETGSYSFSEDVDNKTSYPITSFLIKPRDHHFAIRSYRYDNGTQLFSSYSEDYNINLRNFDNDSDDVVLFFDNCPDVYNPAQTDSDNDTIGDMCDEDMIGNGFSNEPDNCTGDECPAPAETTTTVPSAGTSTTTSTQAPETAPAPSASSTTTTAAPSSSAGSGGSSSGGGGHSYTTTTAPECQQDEDCSGELVCNTDTGMCVECRENADCSGDTVCFTGLGTCVECIYSSHCDDGIACNGLEICFNMMCMPGDTPCDTYELCDEATDSCIPEGPPPECFTNDDCADGLFCNGSEECVNGICRADTRPCGPLQSCNETSQECVDIRLITLPQNRVFRRPFFRARTCPLLIIMLEDPISDSENIVVSIEGYDPSFTGVEADLSRSTLHIGPYLIIPFCISRNASPGTWQATIERHGTGTSYIEMIEAPFTVQ